MNEKELDCCYDFVVDISKQAGKLMQDAWKKEKQVELKECFADLVTETDVQVEKLIQSAIKEKFPEHCFIGEESVADGQHCDLTDAPTWIVDPVDGTSNFVHAIPYFAVSIGFAVKKKMQIGVVYNAVLGEMYTARTGQGAFLNGQRLHVSAKKDLKTSVVIAEFGNQRDATLLDSKFRTMRHVLSNCLGIRSRGSAALNMCHVARGEVEAYYEIGLHCWDMAAGELIVREAGGHVTDTTGGPLDLMSRRFLCACTPEVLQQLQSHIEHIDMTRD